MSFRSINRWRGIKRPISYTTAEPKPILRKSDIVFAGLVSAMVYVFAITGGSFQLLVSVQGFFILWVVFSIVFSQRRIVFTARNIIVWLTLAVVLSSNLLVNLGNYVAVNWSLAYAVAHVGGVLVFVLSAQWAASNLQPSYILQYISWMLVPLVIVALATGWTDVENIRAAPFSVHPNWWGEVAFGFILCSLALRRVIVKIIFVAIGAGLMLVVQSRGALLAAIVSLLAFLTMQYRPLGTAAVKRLVTSGVILTGGLLYAMAAGLWSVVLEAVELKILLVNDPYRGLGSDMTGRLARWRDAAEFFLENPIFGHGVDTLSGVHNGFLLWAAEGGILLLSVMLILIGSAMVRAWRRRDDWAFAALLGIVAYLMTYPRGLNLNLVGMVFFFALFHRNGARFESGKAYLPRLQHIYTF